MFMQKNAESDKLIASLGSSSSTTQSTLRDLLALARSKKRAGFDKHQSDLRELYEDRQYAQTLAELERRFKDSYKEMPVETVGIVKRVAEEDASAYRKPPTRSITVGDKRPRLDPTDADLKHDETDDAKAVAKAVAFRKVVKGAKMHSVLREAGRRVVVSKVHFVRVGYREAVPGRAGIGATEGVKLALFWPQFVSVICHHSEPESMLSAYLLVAETEGPDGGTWFEVWRREYMEGVNGELVGFGAWRAEMIPQTNGGDDKRSAYFLYGDGEYPLPTLPWLALYDGLPSGSVYVDEGRDLVRTQLNLNALHSDHLFSIDLHGHPRVVISSTRVKNAGGDIAIGANRALMLETGDSATTLPGDISSEPMLTASKTLRRIAVQRNHPAHRFDDESATILSGKAREIEDRPSNEAREERAEYYKEFEEMLFLPLVVEVADYWGSTGIATPARTQGAPNPERSTDIDFVVDFQQIEDYESGEVSERYAASLLEKGAISLARYAFLAGAYSTVDAAIEHGLSDDIAEKTPDGGGLRAFSAGLGDAFNAAPSPVVEEDTDEGDS